MSTKAALKDYFARLRANWYARHQSLPYTYYDSSIDDLIYFGRFSGDGEEWAYWQPVEKQTHFDFTDIERTTPISLHESLREYFNSYWFFGIEGDYCGQTMSLYSVLPGLEPQTYARTLKEYRTWWRDRETDFAPIGLSGNNEVIVVHKQDGRVCLMNDTEQPVHQPCADSLPHLLAQLDPFIWGPKHPAKM